jgi:receptor tyrosine kinase
VKSNGRFYQGHQNTTATGLTCQTWFSRDPHVQTMPQGIFPEMNLAKNYCRNPGGTEPSPWCYTTDPMIRWQHCKIEPCGKFFDFDFTSWSFFLFLLFYWLLLFCFLLIFSLITQSNFLFLPKNVLSIKNE